MIPDKEFPIPHDSDQSQPEDPPPPDPHTETHPKATPSQVFDHRTRFQYCHLLRQGLTKGAAARLLGVSPRTIQLAAKTDLDLADRIRQARLECHAAAAAQVARAGEKSWRAAAWLLERGRRRRKLDRPRKSPLPFSDPLAREQMKQLARDVLLEVMPELRKEITAKRNRAHLPVSPPVDPITAKREARYAALKAEVQAIYAAGQTPDVEALWAKHFPGVPLPAIRYPTTTPNHARNSAHPNAQPSPEANAPSTIQNNVPQQVATTAPVAAEPDIAQNP
jgi:hypothetical protein